METRKSGYVEDRVKNPKKYCPEDSRILPGESTIWTPSHRCRSRWKVTSLLTRSLTITLCYLLINYYLLNYILYYLYHLHTHLLTHLLNHSLAFKHCYIGYEEQIEDSSDQSASLSPSSTKTFTVYRVKVEATTDQKTKAVYFLRKRYSLTHLLTYSLAYFFTHEGLQNFKICIKILKKTIV